MIVAGHTRYKAAKKLGITDIPCISADDLSDEQIKAFRLADNKTAELAEWDEDLLGKEMQGIINIDMSQFGFSVGEDELGEEMQDDKYTLKLKYRSMRLQENARKYLICWIAARRMS